MDGSPSCRGCQCCQVTGDLLPKGRRDIRYRPPMMTLWVPAESVPRDREPGLRCAHGADPHRCGDAGKHPGARREAHLVHLPPGQAKAEERPVSRYDLVLHGGRVIDPETATDEVCDVGVIGSTIAAVSTTPLEGRRVLDVANRVVAPGFIDMHSHCFGIAGLRLQALD